MSTNSINANLWALLPGDFFRNCVQIEAFRLFFAVVNFLIFRFACTVMPCTIHVFTSQI